MWLRVCSNDHAPLTVMPYIFFKIKNCLNDDLFISCDDRIGKMLHNVCISAVAMSLRWVARGPLVFFVVVVILYYLSTKCSWWAIVVSQCPSCVVQRQQLLKKPTPPTPLGQLTWYLVRSIGVTCRSKIAKIVPIRNPRWPPSWKSIFRFFSWTERPIDSKLARKHQDDL